MGCGSTAMAVDSTAVSATANSSTADDATTTTNSNAEDSATANSNAEDLATPKLLRGGFGDGEFQCRGFGDGELLSCCEFGADELLADLATATWPGLLGENIGETLLLRHNVQILQTRGSMLKNATVVKPVFRGSVTF